MSLLDVGPKDGILHLMLQTILITSNGACKLGAFGFTPTGHSSSDSANVQAFHYAAHTRTFKRIPRWTLELPLTLLTPNTWTGPGDELEKPS
ncbi:uncharacterized protein [Coffea arabica]|uniref:Uncharacterized protein isoform X5 n=1 Tax=Coffea arabica TaxID=13443 RepID=A0ABM4WAS6_COFAR